MTTQQLDEGVKLHASIDHLKKELSKWEQSDNITTYQLRNSRSLGALVSDGDYANFQVLKALTVSNIQHLIEEQETRLANL